MECSFPREDIARLALGEVDPERRPEIERHVAGCETCRARLRAVERTDVLLAKLRPVAPETGVTLRVRQVLRCELDGDVSPEVLTLEQVASILQLGPDEMAEIAEELPAFEVAGRIRVRRDRLMDWVKDRERVYQRQRLESEVAHILADDRPARRYR